MNAKIRLTRHDRGLTIADDRTGLRLEVVELEAGMMLEAYAYHGQPVDLVTFPAGARGAHPEAHFVVDGPKPVPSRKVR